MTSTDTGHASDTRLVVCSFLCGALTGAAVALLLAPARGRETRERLAVKAREGREQASKVLDHASQAVSEGRAALADIRERGERALQNIRHEAAEAVAEARTAYRSARSEAAPES
jgi:gas vesicle protein